MNLTIELRDEVAQALEAKAHQIGLSAEEFVQQVIERQISPEVLPQAEDSEPVEYPSEHHIDYIRRIWADVPPEEFDKIPKDWATQLDHYIYGSPKSEE